MGKRSKEYTNGNGSSLMKMIIAPRSDEQKILMKTIAEKSITFVSGAPGTGKTLISVHYALQQYLRDKYKRIIFTRPVVEAGGEKLGFLPGDLHEKINPYMLPIFSTLQLLVDDEVFNSLTNRNGRCPAIQILPLAYMRGLTFHDSIVVSDEMQNATPEQVRMLITRLGESSKIILCGDIRQSDIDRRSGLEDAFHLLQDIDDIGFVRMSKDSIMRHPLIKSIEERYDNRSRTDSD